MLPTAVKELAELPRDTQRRIAKRIEQLPDNPRPHGCKLLRGQTGAIRIRIGDYRVLYRVTDQTLEILIIQIGHRRDVYR